MSFDQQHASYHRSAVSLWNVIFRLDGNVMFAVLPLCILNCLLLTLVGFFRKRYKFEFSPNGHGLLTLLVSFLVISKVNLSYERYKAVRQYAGQGSIALRELIQMVMAVSNKSSGNGESHYRELQHWGTECVAKVTDLLDASVCVLQNRSLAKHFAYNKDFKAPPVVSYNKTKNFDCGNETPVQGETIVSDPLTLIQSLRLHLYCTPGLGIELLERVHLVNKLMEYTSCYSHLISLASTPLPFPLVQMGRAFLLLWTFSMPLVLLDGPFSSMWAAQIFLFFLTYGFIGLELVSIKISDPFGNSRDDVQISGIRDATILGIENDLKEIATMRATISELGRRFSQQKNNGNQDHDPGSVYHAMSGGDILL